MTTMDVLVRGKALAIQDGAESWANDADLWKRGESAGAVRLPESLLESSEEIVKTSGEVLQLAWRQANRADPSVYPWQEKGEMLERMLAVVIDPMDAFDADLRAAEANGVEIIGVEAFRASHRKATALRQRFAEEWPMYRSELATAASARIAAGGYVTLEGLSSALDAPL